MNDHDEMIDDCAWCQGDGPNCGACGAQDPEVFVPFAVDYDETSEEFTARIIATIEARMVVLALRD